MKTTQYTLSELNTLFVANQWQFLNDDNISITLDNQNDVSCIELLNHDGHNYFVFSNPSTNLNKSFWCTDNNIVTICEQETVQEQEVQQEEQEEQEVQDVLNINGLAADLVARLSKQEIMILISKLAIAASAVSKKTKTEKENKPTDKKDRVSAKNFNYYLLLKSWHNVKTDKIMTDGLNGGYSSSVINEDKRVINVLMRTDKDIQISQEWADYIIQYWEDNPDTTWTKLHYAFAKGGRKCQDVDILCNYVINNGVSREDIENAIAAQSQ